MNDLQRLVNVLKSEQNEVIVDETIRSRAAIPIKRMIDYGQSQSKWGIIINAL